MAAFKHEVKEFIHLEITIAFQNNRANRFLQIWERGGRWRSEMANVGRHRLLELGWDILRETRDGPGGRVSLTDHRGSRYD